VRGTGVYIAGLVVLLLAGIASATGLAKPAPSCERRWGCTATKPGASAPRPRSTRSTTTPTPTTTASGAPAPSWAGETAFAAPPFAPARTIVVSTAAAFWSAWSRIQPGDEIDVHGVAFSGEAVFAKQLSGWAEVHFDAATTFTGLAGKNLPAVWIDASRHVRFYGGTITNPQGGAGVLVYDSADVSWWNFAIHDVGGSGLMVQGIRTANTNLDFKGEISHWGENPALDPHAEKGTGLHGALLADADYGVENSRFALFLHDGDAGAGLEAGGARSTDVFAHNTLYLRCRNLTMRATSQVGGNCVQLWGAT
jgi:hypothetical protein